MPGVNTSDLVCADQGSFRGSAERPTGPPVLQATYRIPSGSLSTLGTPRVLARQLLISTSARP